jgi:hypothetical protein
MSISLYAQLLREGDSTYSNKVIAAHVVVIKCTKSLKAQQTTKYRLFFILSKLFIKAINNFNHLTKTVPKHKILHTPEDIAMECYLTFDTCLKNVDMRDVKKFYFFLNTALNRGMYRLYEKQYKKYFNIVENTDENAHLLNNAGYSQHVDFSEVDLKDFTALELDILKLKVQGGKLSVFLKEQQIPSAVFHKTFEGIKEKLTELYSDENYFKIQQV